MAKKFDVTLKNYMNDEKMRELSFSLKCELKCALQRFSGDICAVATKWFAVYDLSKDFIDKNSTESDMEFSLRIDSLLKASIIAANDNGDNGYNIYEIPADNGRYFLSAKDLDNKFEEMFKNIKDYSSLIVDKLYRSMYAVNKEIKFIEYQLAKGFLNDEYIGKYLHYTFKEVSNVNINRDIYNNILILLQNINYLFHIICNIENNITFYMNIMESRHNDMDQNDGVDGEEFIKSLLAKANHVIVGSVDPDGNIHINNDGKDDDSNVENNDF